MANWMIRLGEEYLGVLYDHLHKLLYDYHVIQADETPVLVNKDGRSAGSKSYMWVYRSGFMYPERQIVLYEYQKTRNASHPRNFLKDYTGICVTDGYQVYHTLEKEREDLRILCQLEALDSCHCIIAIGGKTNGSANMLLRFAEGKRKMIVPLIWAGGAAQASYDRRIYQLMDILGDDLNLLNNRIGYSKIIEKIEIDRQCILRPIEEREVFISYARKRPHEADYIETLLRRRNISVFRDESEFGAGEDIPIQIEEHIHRANTFIAVYCTEYACSPWCYDELELALDLREKNQIDIWLICVDDTRIVSKRARNLMFYKTHSREDIEGKILKLIMQ